MRLFQPLPDRVHHDQRGVESLQSVVVLAVGAIALISLHRMYDRSGGMEEMTVTRLDELFDSANGDRGDRRRGASAQGSTSPSMADQTRASGDEPIEIGDAVDQWPDETTTESPIEIGDTVDPTPPVAPDGEPTRQPNDFFEDPWFDAE